MNCALRFPEQDERNPQFALDCSRHRRLQTRQREAFALTSWTSSFIWGPPGYGKDDDLRRDARDLHGTLPACKDIASIDYQRSCRSSAVAVDKQLETGGSATWVHRRGCKRIGNNFRAGFYEGRQHLLPAQDEVTLRELAMHQAQRPDPTDAHAYSIWKTRAQLRSRLKRNQQMVIENCRLAAMTTTAAVFHFDVLEARGGYDIVVFDESSQVSLAHAFMLAPLGQRRLYTGDPMQLSPIVQSANPMTLKWLGKSVFQRVDLASPMMCQLDEQWRMAQPICNVVSQLFYEGRLRVASDAANDPAWKRERELVPLKGLPARAIHVESIVHDGQWSAKYKGPIRFESAKRIVTLVESLLSHVEPDDIVVITPFRAQRALIRSLLRRDGTKGVSVSTVHRAQGSERHTVIFDPVQGDSEFLTGPEADRLVNVAISRAQARLILLLSPVDRNHPKLSQVEYLSGDTKPVVNGIPIRSLIQRSDFPACMVGKTIATDKMTFRCVKIDKDGTHFSAIRLPSGGTIDIDWQRLRKTYGFQS